LIEGEAAASRCSCCPAWIIVTSAADLPDKTSQKIIEEFSCIAQNFP
jgi:hypothetical protein